jgi:hypothetical protein
MTVLSVLCSQPVGRALCGCISILVKASDLIIAVTCSVHLRHRCSAWCARRPKRARQVLCHVDEVSQSESIERKP